MTDSELKPYIEYYSAYHLERKPLKPTGRWMLATNHDGSITMFVEHKGLFFNNWIGESSIVFLCDKSEVIFQCEQP